MPKSKIIPFTDRMRNLMEAVRDLSPLEDPPPGGQGGVEHRSLHARYVTELDVACVEALEWYREFMARSAPTPGGPRVDLSRFGEVDDPGAIDEMEVISLVRKYFLACVSLNRTLPPPLQVRPEEFMLPWLVEAGRSDLAQFLSTLPYWPVGMDEKGYWI